jgi:type III pantothenate kinase
MIVCLDSGNSRIKWGVHDGAQWLAQGAVAQADVAELSALPAQWPSPERVMLANVAGEVVGQRIRRQLAAWQPRLVEAGAREQQCGVTNLYDKPERLGVDRWCALIGAWRMQPAPAVVVMAGTATTIDTLDEKGHFRGGLILPGMGMMLDSLASGTAALPYADGQYLAYPRATADAIVTGVIDAQIGAIERVYARLGQAGACCVMSGGYAERLATHLALPHRVAQNLPLEGLLQMALAS